MSVFLRTLLGCACVLGILLTIGCSGNDSDQKKPPNILLILTDDLGNNDIASWGDGTAPTPTLDKLSRESLRFRRHYTDSTCSVSRAALLTGRAPVNINFQPDGLALSADLPTLPKSLKALGYRTYHIGKWHVGEGIEYPTTWPLQQGFDQWFGMFNHFLLRGPDVNGIWVGQKPTYLNPWLQKNNEPARQYNGHLDDLLTDYAVEVINASRHHQPWFVNLWLFSPHLPLEPSERFRARFPDTEQGRYLAVLSQLDSNVNRVLATVEKSGQLDNTIIVFSSDNGSPNVGRDNNWPLDGIKATYKEGGVRTPLLILWPGHYENAEVDAISHITDIYPTLLSMAGGEAPTDIDGVNLLKIISGQPETGDRELYWAADLKDWGMMYAGYIPGKGGFYRNLFNQFEQVKTSSAYLNEEITGVTGNFSREQGSSMIREWESIKRPVPLEWQWNPDGATGKLSGRDFQRTPAFGPFAIGLGIIHKPSEKLPQTLAEQEGVWRLEINPQGLLAFQYGAHTIIGPVPVWRDGCNTIIVSLNINPAYTYPFKAEAASSLKVFLNGHEVISSEEVLSRPDSEQVFHNSTYIGISPDGSKPFSGFFGRPELVNKFLATNQEGYNLEDMMHTICMPQRMAEK